MTLTDRARKAWAQRQDRDQRTLKQTQARQEALLDQNYAELMGKLDLPGHEGRPDYREGDIVIRYTGTVIDNKAAGKLSILVPTVGREGLTEFAAIASYTDSARALEAIGEALERNAAMIAPLPPEPEPAPVPAPDEALPPPAEPAPEPDPVREGEEAPDLADEEGTAPAHEPEQPQEEEVEEGKKKGRGGKKA